MLLFLFLGMVDFGWYVYSFIQVGNAARAAAQFTATGGGVNQDRACKVALQEMKTMANVAVLDPIKYKCTAVAPLQVGVVAYKEKIAGVDTSASQVTITYQTMLLFQLPFMDKQMTINRVATMRTMPPGT